MLLPTLFSLVLLCCVLPVLAGFSTIWVLWLTGLVVLCDSVVLGWVLLKSVRYGRALEVSQKPSSAGLEE